MDFKSRPMIVFNLKHKEEKKKFHETIKKMHERKNKEVDHFKRQQLKEDIDNKIVNWNQNLYPKSWKYFDPHFMSEEGLAMYAEVVYNTMGVGSFTFNTGCGNHSPNGVSANQMRLLKMFKGRPGCTVRIDKYNIGLVILERRY
ncbi:hypothetical protein GCK72_025368 [Caenorhabditis remanei]|uniref:Smr domain-containing protein n=1 Tax=Caenorhabditis remanei TaxID=31234 RepID=E3MJR3_CAERE|nr:hypothetical protein GCK72_025368 [Caenorhabditis remanei]EFP03700.1 hypothetical protein CRE_19178 [Caenorhabditis remanei]KAF1748901.1 hypothetical protein GCK72_025368 [Caenorhabditis remanei]